MKKLVSNLSGAILFATKYSVKNKFVENFKNILKMEYLSKINQLGSGKAGRGTRQYPFQPLIWLIKLVSNVKLVV